ncbi:Bbp16 family capsid cement protein [Sutterella sp.]|uniref:Bbp16 family capsid cement protein n=1 Tax=Sutterella sp. TaxID=1981025 RepID=UPI0026E08A0D|nr:hypothetical protein [Sutterella sp.]MDO5531062.1 hypothetical protein [Sutterella sp.]
MLLDTLSEFSDGQALSGSSAYSTNTLDLAGAGIAVADHAYVVVSVLTATASDLKAELQCSEDGSTWRAVASGSVETGAAGDQIVLDIPPDVFGKLRLAYTGTSMTGTVHAGVTLGAQTRKRIGDFAASANGA